MNQEKFSHWYFNHPKHKEIAEDRYFLKDENGNLLETDIDQVFARVVKYLIGFDSSKSDIKLHENTIPGNAKLIYNNLKEKRLMPGGRILSQAGTLTKNLYNCFVLGLDDTKESIAKAMQQHFMIQAQGGGTGFNFSKLRPRWSWVNGNQSRSCGSIGYITGFSYWSSLIAQGGNRSGANITLCEDWHPDLLDFIDWKSTHNWLNQISEFSNIHDQNKFSLFEWNNPYQWQQFNVSVALSDKFMKLLKEDPDTEWQLYWKDINWMIWKFLANGQEYEVTAPDQETAESKLLSQFPFFNKSNDFKLIKGNYNLTVKQLWHRIAKNAHEDGCPGILYIDKIRDYHNGEYFNPIEATNPCVVGDTLIAVADGRNFVSIKQLACEVKDVPVYCKNIEGITVIRMLRNPRTTGYNKKIYEVELNDGSKIKCTGNHKFILKNGIIKEAQKLSINDSLEITSKWISNYDEFFGKNSERKNNYWIINDGQKNHFEHKLLYESLNHTIIPKGYVIHHRNRISLDNSISNLEMLTQEDHQKIHNISGDKNPVFRLKDRKRWLENLSKASSGKNNGMYDQKHSSETLEKISKKSIENWRNQYDFMCEQIKKSWQNVNKNDYSKKCKEREIKKGEKRLKEYQQKTDLKCVLLGPTVNVIRNCENCGHEYFIRFNKREIAFCENCWDEAKRKKYSIATKTAYEPKKIKKKKILQNLLAKYINNTKQIPNAYEFSKLCKEIGFADHRTFGIGKYTDFLKDSLSAYAVNFEIGDTRTINTKKHKARELFDSGFIYNHKVVNVTEVGVDTVYTGTVDEFHNFGIILNEKLTNSNRKKLEFIYTMQCGEEPLPANSVCDLGVVNVFYCMNDKDIDEQKFRDSIIAGVKMLNYVIDVSKTGIKEIDENALRERRIGLGTTGWHDVLIKKKLRYSSEEGRKYVEKWMKFFRDESYRVSIELAKIDGIFPAFDYDGFSKSKFFKTLPKDIQDDIKKYGIRNVTINTIAPYGTTGTIMGTSTGCEPHFALEYTRNSRVGSYKDGCQQYIDYVEQSGTKNIPDYFESSHDISWEDHLKMQAVFAKYIDASVSKTINLPNSATISDIKKAYELAFDLGIKSTTVYRDGSKTQILETLDSKKVFNRPSKIIRHHAPKRPELLLCDIHRVTVKGTIWIVMVGMLDNEPYEIFAGKQANVELDEQYGKGEIVKVASNKYYLKCNGTKINIKEVFENAEQAALTRQISMNLRHGTDIQFIVNQLEKSEDSIVEFSKAIGRVLKKYIIKEQYKVSKNCLNCNSSNIEVILESGCEKILCKQCGDETTKCQ